MGLLQEIPILGRLFDTSEADAQRQYEEALQSLMQADPRQGQYQQVYRPFTPEAAKHQITERDPLMRGKQEDYLSKLAGLSEGGLSAQDSLALEEMNRASSAAMQSGAANASRDARARGVSGGGLEFALGQQAGQAGAQDARMAGAQKAAQQANQRALYTQAYGNALGNVRGQDENLARANTGIVNEFNKYNTGVMNESNLRNLNEQNRVAQGNYGNMAGFAGNVADAKTNRGGQLMKQGERNAQTRGNNLNTIAAGADVFGVNPTDWFKKQEEEKPQQNPYYGPGY